MRGRVGLIYLVQIGNVTVNISLGVAWRALHYTGMIGH